ncbi:MAG: DUF429 domain-containing protein [Chloroflexi bacterium]|nr:DUF429 domain-containing protein [Chloroflexota bacterium]
MTRCDFLGIDPTSSPGRASACVGLDEDLNLAFAGSLHLDSDLIALAMSEWPGLIAIDAPLTLPTGLCCLEESCHCQPERGSGRECERDLAKLGIPCYFTGKRSIIKNMTYRGVMLRKALEGRGFRVIEVYPYASKVRLWGKHIPPKGKREGLDFLQANLGEIMPSVAPYLAGFNHDLCDAAVAAYTAYLHASGKTEVLGSRNEGVICIPNQHGGSVKGPDLSIELQS